jgi:hypothetical protein
MTALLHNSITPGQLSLLNDLSRIDRKLREKASEARDRDKYWQNNSIRGLFISDAEISDLVARPIDRGFKSNCPVDLPGGPGEESPPGISHSSVDENSRLAFLARIFGLSDFEKDVVLLAMLPEIDLAYERLFGYVQDDVTRRKPSAGLALDVLCTGQAEKMRCRAAFSSSSALVRYHIIELQEEINRKNSPLLSRAIKLDERIRDCLLGFDHADTNLDTFAVIAEPSLQIERHVAPATVKNNLLKILGDGKNKDKTALYFWGSEGCGRRSLVDALCFNAGTKYLRVDVPALLSSNLDVKLACTLIRREAIIGQFPIFYHDFDALFADERLAELNNLVRTLTPDGYPGPVFLSGTGRWRPHLSLPDGLFIPVELSCPDFESRRQIWQSQLSGDDLGKTNLETGLSSKFKMNIGEIKRSMIMARSNALYGNGAHLKEDDLYDACRQISGRKLSELAQKINSNYTWADIVLPPEQVEQLGEICNQVKYRHVVYDQWGFEHKNLLGKGLNALFSGPSGTGKTMAAGIISNELKLDLYKIDLSAVVSKYIGETEKNLNHIFKEARNSNSILFFDEADSLFGKRSEVRDSHDRYANIEIAYLLQKMEEYDGIVILATNLGKNIDEAFARRLHFSIEFPFPDEEQRRDIWHRVFPAGAPLGSDIDFDFMSRQFRISGGNIRNIALAAAFLAATADRDIAMEHIVMATKREYQKIGKLCTASEFGSFFEAVRS